MNELADCIFCKIARGDIPTQRLYEDDLAFVFRDLHPQAPTHLLVIPKQHLASTIEATASHAAMLGHLIVIAAGIARAHGLVEGYRLVINTGVDGGQTVQHLHLHLLGGRPLAWPPG